MAWAILGEDQSKAIKEIVGSNSDRIIAVVGGAILDQTFRQTLEERFRKNKDMNRKLFKPAGPLGNLGPKIDLAFQLYVFEKQARNAFYGLSDIRNFFAHRLDASFNSQDKKLSEAIGKLKLHENRTHYPNPHTREESDFKIEPVSNNRDVFLVNLKLGLIFLMADRLYHHMFTNTPLDNTTPPLA